MAIIRQRTGKLERLHGYKSYFVAGVMAILGLMFLSASVVSTWDDPQAGDVVVGAVRRIVGWVLLTQAVATASLRHAISRL